ncbi:hypothetical protein HF086_002933 [Spodoptera exigua]|uniref:Uncharacterized protein n=1 Tax=Spodoptera exigua TaxID=7107 RepID=A0A922MKS6_SPOEX|nr:hypothetical protein HF086_002933 [Spodoptera exigua]
MGKRKRSDSNDVEKLLKRVKKLVKKRRRISSSSSESEPALSPLHSLPHDLTSDLEPQENIPQEVIKTLSDAGRLICDTHNRESLCRRFSIINTISKQKREIIKNTKIDDYLFGSNLSDHLKSNKAITMSASKLRFTATSGRFNQQRNQQNTYRPTGTLNGRGAPRAPAAELRVYHNQTRHQPPPPPRDHRRAQAAPRARMANSSARRR